MIGINLKTPTSFPTAVNSLSLEEKASAEIDVS